MSKPRIMPQDLERLVKSGMKREEILKQFDLYKPKPLFKYVDPYKKPSSQTPADRRRD